MKLTAVPSLAVLTKHYSTIPTSQGWCKDWTSPILFGGLNHIDSYHSEMGSPAQPFKPFQDRATRFCSANWLPGCLCESWSLHSGDGWHVGVQHHLIAWRILWRSLHGWWLATLATWEFPLRFPSSEDMFPFACFWGERDFPERLARRCSLMVGQASFHFVPCSLKCGRFWEWMIS